jgi:hypothetical protein
MRSRFFCVDCDHELSPALEPVGIIFIRKRRKPKRGLDGGRRVSALGYATVPVCSRCYADRLAIVNPNPVRVLWETVGK